MLRGLLPAPMVAGAAAGEPPPFVTYGRPRIHSMGFNAREGLLLMVEMPRRSPVLPRFAGRAPVINTPDALGLGSGALIRTPVGRVGTMLLGTSLDRENTQIWTGIPLLASRHPHGAALHQPHLGFARKHHCPFHEHYNLECPHQTLEKTPSS